ncbi:hypothetical protein BIV57_05190 [Mangrovactinospora gilvigrisea]|uniref:Uncharacterized protein n=1 Tax=Mangrovactinospora gilvigrisea TaxID=1428644 RepID=A0A1J7CFU3_9ACTN|nr:hypothetical protein [Mangrovactinospora gilvigrisea]OIV38530.1 hypothetical protein BIV57_05190 [Mangrovactinospora gilvigrisea]
MTERDDARDAGLLLLYVLNPAALPARNGMYGDLLDRFVADPDFRGICEENYTALGLRVLGARRSAGLIVGADPDSPLAVTGTDRWLRITCSDDRLIYGLSLAGAAAWCYPTAHALTDSATRRVTAPDVDRLIRQRATALEASGPDQRLGAAWGVYKPRQQAVTTSQGRLRRTCTVRMCEDTLAMLGHFRLLISDTTVQGPRPDLKVWRSTDRFRLHIAGTGGPLIRQALQVAPLGDDDHLRDGE